MLTVKHYDLLFVIYVVRDSGVGIFFQVYWTSRTTKWSIQLAAQSQPIFPCHNTALPKRPLLHPVWKQRLLEISLREGTFVPFPLHKPQQLLWCYSGSHQAWAGLSSLGRSGPWGGDMIQWDLCHPHPTYVLSIPPSSCPCFIVFQHVLRPCLPYSCE